MPFVPLGRLEGTGPPGGGVGGGGDYHRRCISPHYGVIHAHMCINE